MLESPLFNIAGLVKRRLRDKGYQLLIRRFRARPGAKIAIAGPSGCGKSTTLDILGLSLAPDSADQFSFNPPGGSLDIMALWREKRLDALAGTRLAWMGYVPQTGELLPFLSAGENMSLSALLAGQSRARAEDSARKLAEKLDIAHLWRSMPGALSVGERQRVAIARALAPKPLVILADEPTAALDPLSAARAMDAFLEALDEAGSALILATHDSDWAKRGGLRELRFQMVEGADGATAILDDPEAES